MPSVTTTRFVSTKVTTAPDSVGAVIPGVRRTSSILRTQRTVAYQASGVTSLNLVLEVAPVVVNLVYQFDDFGELQFDDYSTVELI